MADLLPPVALTLIANVTEAIAGVESFGAATTAMAGETAAAGRTATAGLDAAVAGTTEAASAAEAQAAKITRSHEQVQRSMQALSAQADRTAEQWYVDSTRMAAATQKMTLDMEAAEARAVASTEAMGAKMDEVAATSTGFGATVAAGAKRMMLVGAGAAVVGVATVKMAGDFEASTTRLVTSAGETEANLDKVRQGILGMAGEVGYSAEQLSAAMYTIESGGRHGAEGLQVLRAAAEGAKTENASLKTVADAVTSVLQDYHLKGQDAADVTSKLVAATGAGKTNFEELAASLSAVLPVASAAHVSLDDILGSLASMTVHGMSAQQSAQNLTDVIRHMQNPTQVQSKELALLGINAQDLGDKMRSSGISGTLQMIADKIKSSLGSDSQKVILDLGTALKNLPKDVQDLGTKLIEGTVTQKGYSKAAQGMNPIAAHQAAAFATLAASTHAIGNKQMTGAQVMQSYGAALAKATGDSTGLNVALMLTGDNAQTTHDAVGTVAGAAKEAGDHVKGWGEIQSTFNQKVSQAKDGLGAMAIEIGERLLPVASKIAGVIGDVTKFLAEHKDAATGVAIVLGGMLVLGLAAATLAVWDFTVALLANPAVWIVVGIMALVAAIVLLVKNWDKVSAWLTSVWNGFIGWAKGVWDGFAGWWAGIWNAVWKWVSDRITDIRNFAVSLFNTVINWIVQRWTDFIQFWVDLWNQIWKWCSDRLTDIRNWVQGRINDVIGFIHRLAEVPGQVSDWFGRMRDAVVDRFNDAVAFVRGIPGRVLSALGDLGGLLLGAGRAIINGFLNGLKSAWNSVTSFVSGIGGWIADHKGPIDYDRQLLVPHGLAIMDGLHEGLVNGGRQVQSYLDGFTTGIGNTALTGSISMADNAFSGSGSASGGAPTIINVTVEGSVVAERELGDLIQRLALQRAARNPTNGLALGLATGGR
ncbi:phage tail tape measure protein [Amycolatopsis sp. NPDC051716]|uniref:phage tail tape measure protein n=1 Tax=Amycolatopsis sp. NPDC051716 TaxID=3155804 RepID=UPI003432C6A3